MAAENLTDEILSLTPQQQDAVRRFIDYLKGREARAGSQSATLQATCEFKHEHPELLRRLAQ